jgi:hypothetical protein
MLGLGREQILVADSASGRTGGGPALQSRGARLCRLHATPPWPLQEEETVRSHCLSYSPLLTRFRTLKPAFLASEMENDRGELKLEKTLRTGFLQAGHLVKGEAERGRKRVNFPPQTAQSPSQSSYS